MRHIRLPDSTSDVAIGANPGGGSQFGEYKILGEHERDVVNCVRGLGNNGRRTNLMRSQLPNFSLPTAISPSD